MDLRQYAETPIQIATIDAIENNNGNLTHAAREMKINLRTLQRTVDRIKRNKKRHLSASNGYAPELGLVKPASAGIGFIGASVLSRNPDPDSDISLVWNKYKVDKVHQEEAFKEFINGLAEGIKGEADPIKEIKQKYDKDLMSLIILGDAHLGMYAWGEETLERDFDTDIACAEIRDAVDNMIARAPNAETGVLIDVGDFMHSNTSANSTGKGTPVDVDTRHSRVLKAAGMVMRYCIDKMLNKYKKVIVVVAKGNHNPEPAIAVSLMLQFYYDREKRVEVLDTIGHHHYIEFGDWLLGVNHGDKIKPQKLVAMMARDHKSWSKCRFRLWILGHIHHERVIELDGCTVASFNTLAPSDAWHASMGYSSRSSATLITIHKTKGKHSTIEYDLPKK